ncbi:TPA: PTS transporter subunit EIIB [Staphylococcus aureus]|nr:PTS transporter subunit EIIB [Staphylococcus aureus]HDJ6916162.1 PTS transporter subunit EIIB [Staphylococcus aureus Sa_TPS3169]HDJ6919333.1 PTS transporter subunit EIIB [Staphylococcus aureus Sa_TPS3162]HDJ6927289.1 PTS transporter subunit EIIB [Staphylococcus aureus Sa_TPS3157]HDJ6929876.1 PTS transporter subunit EIIB [Staphylococcus aureus Sa_TPS3148]HDJ6936331.1 PTS transporter subunit EIIB [Staphylococcus aureus Sa_TPS3161]HDJ6941300.1 PTS transporter subunit EIIB [Staphylococcus aure
MKCCLTRLRLQLKKSSLTNL